MASLSVGSDTPLLSESHPNYRTSPTTSEGLPTAEDFSEGTEMDQVDSSYRAYKAALADGTNPELTDRLKRIWEQKYRGLQDLD